MTINRILAHTIVSGLLLTLLIPFIISTSFFFPFITGKNFAFRIITELVFGLWLILALRDVNFRPKFSWLGTALAVFVALIGIADIMSPNGFKSFWSNFERMEGFITLIHLFAYFVVASSVLQSEKRWMRFFQTSVAASVIMSFYGMFQLAGKITINQGGVRLDGTLGNATYLAVFMLINFFLALFLLIRSRKSVAWRWVYGIAMILQLYTLYHTATRGAILGLIGGLFVAAASVVLTTREKVVRVISGGVLAVIVLVVLLGMGAKNYEFVKNQPSFVRLTSISTSEAGPRFMVWTMAWQGFKERPILGWGQESFNYVFNKYYDPKMYAQEQWFDRTHNIVFDWLIAGGALGLLGYLSIFFLALYYLWKQAEMYFSLKQWCKRFFQFARGHEIPHLLEKSVLSGLLAAYFFQNLFVFDNITSYILFFSVLAYIHTISARPFVKLTQHGKPDPALVNRVLVPLVIVFTVFGVYVINASPMRVSAALIDALRPQQEGPTKNLEYFKKALSYSTVGDSEVREQLAQAAIQVLYAQSVPLALKQEYYNFARVELIKQTERTPDDARYFLFLGSFLNRAGNTDEAIAALERSFALSPNKQTIMFELASSYVNKGDFPKALEIMKRAYDLEPAFSESRIIYAVVAIYAKDFSLASELTKPLEDSSREYDDRLIQAYTNAGRLETVSTLLEKKVEQNPTDSQARFTLAGSYLSRGLRTKAVDVLQTVLTDFPTQKDQADYYIREIQAGRNP